MTQFNSFPAPPAPGLHPAGAPGLSLGDIYYVLFRHKWKILLCALLGLVAAGLDYRLKPASYSSAAKLFIRFVTEGRSPGPTNDEITARVPDERGETIINSEVQILTSLDLAEEVAARIGPSNLIGSSGEDDAFEAAILIARNLTIEAPPKSSVIRVSFKHRNPDVARSVLRELITSYFARHKEVHGARGFVGDAFTQETEQLRTALTQTERELQKIKNQLGVVSLEQAKIEYHAQIVRLSQEIQDAEAELARRTAVVTALTEAAPAQADIDAYTRILGLLEEFTRQEKALLTRYRPETPMVQAIRAQITEQDEQKRQLEELHPSLAIQNRSGVDNPNLPARPTDIVGERAQLVGLESALNNRRAQLRETETKIKELNEMESEIRELERRKERQELDYRTLSTSLDQARIGEALGAGRVSNISLIQEPTQPSIDDKTTRKIIGGLILAGMALGLAWAFFIELYLDRSIRRPGTVEKQLRIPLFLSIPDISRNRQRRLVKAARERRALTASGTVRPSDGPTVQPSDHRPSPALPSLGVEGTLDFGPSPAVIPTASWSENHPLHPYYETLRDRLIGYFESRNLTHKPKLVAVTSMGANAGVTNLSAGLASCLSEAGEGNVLLVDLTVKQGSAQQFFNGKAVCGLEEMLDTRSNAQVQDNLFVVADSPHGRALSHALPQRFSKLVPKLKASDFDYIIFDMPPVSQISVTPRLAGFMDMVLLVLESEKTSFDVAERGVALLAESRSHIGAVLNKTRTYVPHKLHQEFLSDS